MRYVVVVRTGLLSKRFLVSLINIHYQHHDYGFYHLERQFGPRIITFFLYLNDVDEGGETEFPLLGLKVTPKKGKALLWPSVLDEDPLQIDYRTRHGALTVTKGVKYGANAWVRACFVSTLFASWYFLEVLNPLLRYTDSSRRFQDDTRQGLCHLRVVSFVISIRVVMIAVVVQKK
jgi:hypothetical protein